MRRTIMDHKLRKIHRRRFMQCATVLGASLFSSTIAGCKRGKLFGSSTGYLRAADFEGPEPLPPTRIYPPMPKAVVSVTAVRNSIEKAVREAVEAAGGISEIEPGQRVMIKPNITSPIVWDLYPPGRITTNPEVIQAVIRMVKERGAHPMVGDRGFFLSELAFVTTGFDWVCNKEGAEGFPFNRSEYVRFFSKKRHWSQGFRIPKILTEVDHFINVPVLKNHETNFSDFTCCLKSFVGVCHPQDRRLAGADSLHVRNISEKIAELNLCLKPLINIVDATTIMVRGGPGDCLFWGDPFYKVAVWDQPNLILASKDRVACDSVALAVLKLSGADKKVDLDYVEKSVWDQVQIYYAAELGIGQAEPEKITIEDIKVERFDEIKGNWV